MKGFSESAAVVTKNRASRRLAAKLGMKLDELLIGFSTGFLVSGQRRVSEEVRKQIRWRLKNAKEEIAKFTEAGA